MGALAWVLPAPAGSVPGACLFQHPHHFAEAALPCKLERRVALPVGQRLARTRPQQGLQGRLLARAAVAQHDGLDERRPVQVVHMVQRRASGDQLPHHAVVTQVGSGDERRAVVAAGHLFGAGAQLQQHAQRGLVVGHGGNGHGVVTVVFQQIQASARFGKGADRFGLPRVGGHMQRCAAVSVAGVQIGPCRDQLGERMHVTPRRSGMQALVGRCFGRRGRHLGLGRGGTGQCSGQCEYKVPVLHGCLRWRALQVWAGGYFSRSCTLAMPATAHCSSRWPPGAPPTPTAPMTSLPTFTGTPPPSSR